MAEELNTLTGSLSIPLHGIDGKSAYEVACDLGYTGTAEEWLARLLKNDKRVWNAEADIVSSPKTGEEDAPLSAFEEERYEGDLFLVAGNSDTAAFDGEKYDIHGSNGALGVGDYILRLNGTWVRLCTCEAKASTLVSEEGKYSPSSGVSGLLGSDAAAYLSDLIDNYWDQEKLCVYPSPDSAGWLVNQCTDNAFYLGGLDPNCDAHPPVLNDNAASWSLLNLNGMRMSEDDDTYNYRLQLAFDLANNLIYMRRGLITSGEYGDWVKIGDIADGSITENKLSQALASKITAAQQAASDANEAIDALKGYVFLTDADGIEHKGILKVKDNTAVFVYDD